VADFLDGEVRLALDGRVAFHTRVAVNALRTVERELRSGPDVVAAERARLRELTGSDADLHTQNALLASRIRGGELSIEDKAVRDHLIRSVLSRLAIDNPGYPSLAEARRYWPLP
jgi:hypothetical protein